MNFFEKCHLKVVCSCVPICPLPPKTVCYTIQRKVVVGKTNPESFKGGKG